MRIKSHNLHINQSTDGNMTLMTCLSLGLMVLGLVIALGFWIILSEQKLGQTQCDDIALDLTKSLNEGDRIGQMNETVEHARELVYLSRQDLNSSNDLNMPDCSELANLLLTESIESSKAVEKERSNQINIAVNNCRNRSMALHNSRTERGAWLLPWFIEDQLYLRQTQFATTDDLSNVSSAEVIKELHKFDLGKNYVEVVSNLYYGNIDAKLPPPDTQLDFFLSALPAQVENTSSPARLANQSDFTPTALIFDSEDLLNFSKPKQLPETILVSGNMFIVTEVQNRKKPTETKNSKQKQNRLSIAASSAAVTPGAINNAR